MSKSLGEIIDILSLPFPLKDQQKNVIEALVKGKNVFALLPTGYGKSVCYGIFGAIMDKVSTNKSNIYLYIYEY